MAHRFFGQFLLERGLVSRESLLEAVRLQRDVNHSLGALAVAQGLMTAKQVEAANEEQRQRDLLFGEIAVERGFLDVQQLRELLGAQKRDYLYLGEALVQMGRLAADQLPGLLAEFAEVSRRDIVPIDAQWEELQVARPELAGICVDQMRKMLLRVCGLQTKLGSSRVGGSMGGNTPVASLCMSGDVDLELLLTFGGGDDLQAMFTDGFMGMATDDEALIADACREFLNIVAGGAMAALRDRGLRFELHPPTSVDGDGEHDDLLVVPHHCPEGEILFGMIGVTESTGVAPSLEDD